MNATVTSACCVCHVFLLLHLYHIFVHSSRHIKHLLNGLPPRRLACLGAHSAGNETLLPCISHAPPLPNTRVLCHASHIGLVVGADVLERGEQYVGLVVVKDAVYTRCQLSLPLLSPFIYPAVQSLMLHCLICASTSGHTRACTSLYSARC